MCSVLLLQSLPVSVSRGRDFAREAQSQTLHGRPWLFSLACLIFSPVTRSRDETSLLEVNESTEVKNLLGSVFVV